MAFNVERTKSVQTVVDWLHDSRANMFYLLLGHPSGYIADLLVSYDPSADNYETIYEFSARLEVSQWASGDFNTFYIWATMANSLDPSEIAVNTDEGGTIHERRRRRGYYGTLLGRIG